MMFPDDLLPERPQVTTSEWQDIELAGSRQRVCRDICNQPVDPGQGRLRVIRVG